MADKIRGISAAQPISFPRSKGTRNPRMISHAVSTVSELKKGSSKAVTSDQPVRPSARTSTRTTVRSWVVPKLVSKGDFRRILSLRRVIDSIRMGLQEMNQEFFCNKRCRPKRIRQCLTVSSPKRLVKVSKLKRQSSLEMSPFSVLVPRSKLKMSLNQSRLLDAPSGTFVTGTNDGDIRTCPSGVLCAVLRRVPWPRRVFAPDDTDRRPQGWHSTEQWGRHRRRRRKLTRSKPGILRHIHVPREKHRCQRYRRNKRRERVLAGPPRWFAEARGGS